MKTTVFLLALCLTFLIFSSVALAFSFQDFWKSIHDFFVPGRAEISSGPSAKGSLGGIETTSTVSQGVSGKIQVVYKPIETKYLVAGEKLPLPNNYAEIGYLGFNTDKFATVNIRPINGLTLYDASDGSMLFSNLNGIEINSDVANTISD